MRHRLTTIAALFALVGSAAAAETVGGRYTVAGVNVDGSQYEGTADIANASASGCSIAWKIGDGEQNGTCALKGGAFSATYVLDGQKGDVTYKVLPDGRLDGKWTIAGQEGSGTEVLTPVKAAPANDGKTQSAVDFVRSLYTSDPIYNPGFDQPFAAKLTGPALAAVIKNDKESAASGEIACLDFQLSLNAQDSDEPTVRRTLKLTPVKQEGETRATVAASFLNFEAEGVPQDQQTRTVVEYDLQKVKGAWRIADMSAKATDAESFGWRLSELCR